jgi:hypothetical protein
VNGRASGKGRDGTVYLVEDSGGRSVDRSMTHLDMGTKQRTNLEREPDVACCTMRLPSGYTRLPVRSEGNAKERAGGERDAISLL